MNENLMIVRQILADINNSEDNIYKIEEFKDVFGQKRLLFTIEIEPNKYFKYSEVFNTWHEMAIYLRGFQKGANSVLPF